MAPDAVSALSDRGPDCRASLLARVGGILAAPNIPGLAPNSEWKAQALAPATPGLRLCRGGGDPASPVRPARWLDAVRVLSDCDEARAVHSGITSES